MVTESYQTQTRLLDNNNKKDTFQVGLSVITVLLKGFGQISSDIAYLRKNRKGKCMNNFCISKLMDFNSKMNDLYTRSKAGESEPRDLQKRVQWEQAVV